MPTPKGGALLSSVARLLTEKKALVAREQELVEGLNRLLNEMGYEVVAVPSTVARRRAAGRRGRRRGARATSPRARRRARRQAKPAAPQEKAGPRPRGKRGRPARKKE